jgi:hypothetical protein
VASIAERLPEASDVAEWASLLRYVDMIKEHAQCPSCGMLDEYKRNQQFQPFAKKLPSCVT